MERTWYERAGIFGGFLVVLTIFSLILVFVFYGISSYLNPQEQEIYQETTIPYYGTCYYKNGSFEIKGDCSWVDDFFEYKKDLEKRLEACNDEIYRLTKECNCSCPK